jgi:hypothetical protein
MRRTVKLVLRKESVRKLESSMLPLAAGGVLGETQDEACPLVLAVTLAAPCTK